MRVGYGVMLRHGGGQPKNGSCGEVSKKVTQANITYNKNRYFHAFRETKIPLSLAFFQRQQWFVEFQGHISIFAAPCG